MNDLALLMTVYPEYQHLVADSLSAIDKYWPGHPDVLLADSDHKFLHTKIFDAFSLPFLKPFAIMLHEDYRLSGTVKQTQLDECMQFMRENPRTLSCSLTWEPVGKGRRFGNFEELPVHAPWWRFCVNFQARIWNVANYLKAFATIPRDTPHNKIEVFMSDYFADHIYPGMNVVTYAIGAPRNPKTFVDANDKSAWIINYLNVMHRGKVLHRKEASGG